MGLPAVPPSFYLRARCYPSITCFLMYSFSNKRVMKAEQDLSLCVRNACSSSSSFWLISYDILPLIGRNSFPGWKPTNSFTKSRAVFCFCSVFCAWGLTPLFRSACFRISLIFTSFVVCFLSKVCFFSMMRLDRCPFSFSGFPS